MTRTKINKTIAILLAMCLAFAALGLTMLNSAKAEESVSDTLPSGVLYTITAPEKQAGAPDVTLEVTFPEGEDNASKVAADELKNYIKVYADENLDTLVSLGNLQLEDVTWDASKNIFVVPLSKSTGLVTGRTYYLVFEKELTATKSAEGKQLVFAFVVKQATTSSTSSTTTTRTTTTTRRTVTTARTTTRTVTTAKKVTPANTGDNSNMPLWIGLAIVAAGAGAMAYVWKERE